MSKYLLTGGSGTLGTALVKDKPQLYYAPSSFVFNIITNDHPVYKNWDEKYDGIIHCAAYTDVSGAETQAGKTMAAELNVIGTFNMAKLARTLDIPLIYISTDYVYSGSGVFGGYLEDDIAKPFNYYGQTKYIGESFVQRPEDLIIRTSFKPSGPWEYTHAFEDLYTSADYVDVIAPMINLLILSGETGIYNIGTERKTIYELAKSRNPQVSRMSRSAMGDSLPEDVSMNIDKYNNLGLGETEE